MRRSASHGVTHGGVVYFLLGPVLGTNGFRNGRARGRLLASLGGDPQPTG